ncbi:3990_t:CDS:2 [Funneliformis geosporum]|uniref:3990_t:CDS:1 n=1 Tax=Funneliformis geosporum TaxID=1117311 RepID=A0A9W4WM09_9GLOM|nr:3990_t:CDS:2 [Funneliformis geosporum]
MNFIQESRIKEIKLLSRITKKLDFLMGLSFFQESRSIDRSIDFFKGSQPLEGIELSRIVTGRLMLTTLWE